MLKFILIRMRQRSNGGGLDRLIREGEPKGAAKEIHMVW